MSGPILITLKQYKTLDPKSQGYVCYVQADWPGSELKKHQKNPYKQGTKEHELWKEGQMRAVLEAQDSEG